VTAVDAVGHESGASNSIHPTTLDATKPAKPSGLTATAVAGQNRIDLSWTASTDNVGVTGYRIYRNGSATALDSVGGSTTSYSDTTVAPSTQYTYVVTAVDAAANESDPSDPATMTSSDSVAPQPPTTVTATAVSDTQINLSWSGASDNIGVTGYQIFRNGGATPIDTVGASPTTYGNTGLTGGTTYSYTIKAVDAAGNVSAPSPAASARTIVFMDGFENGSLTKWTTVSGLAVQNTNVFAGSWAAEAQSKSAPDFASKTLPSTYTNLYYRMRVKIIQGKPDTADVLRLRTGTGAGTTNLLSIFYDSKKNLGYRNDFTNTTQTSTTALAVGTWYEVKVHLVVNGTSSQVEVWLNGTKITALSRTDSFGVNPITQVVAGETTAGHTYDFAIDEVVADTAP
jgi:chitodextrinase